MFTLLFSILVSILSVSILLITILSLFVPLISFDVLSCSILFNFLCLNICSSGMKSNVGGSKVLEGGFRESTAVESGNVIKSLFAAKSDHLAAIRLLFSEVMNFLIGRSILVQAHVGKRAIILCSMLAKHMWIGASFCASLIASFASMSAQSFQ